MEEDKRQLISREIQNFRDTYKVSLYVSLFVISVHFHYFRAFP